MVLCEVISPNVLFKPRNKDKNLLSSTYIIALKKYDSVLVTNLPTLIFE